MNSLPTRRSCCSTGWRRRQTRAIGCRSPIPRSGGCSATWSACSKGCCSSRSLPTTHPYWGRPGLAFVATPAFDGDVVEFRDLSECHSSVLADCTDRLKRYSPSARIRRHEVRFHPPHHSRRQSPGLVLRDDHGSHRHLGAMNSSLRSRHRLVLWPSVAIRPSHCSGSGLPSPRAIEVPSSSSSSDTWTPPNTNVFAGGWTRL